MFPTHVLLATLASLLMLGRASPLPQVGSGVFPRAQPAATGGRPIKWLRESDGVELCLQVDATTGPPEMQLRNDASVTLGNCFGDDNSLLPFQRWVYSQGSTTICVAPNRYSDTEYCIDFGSNLGTNGQRLKIWQRIEGIAAQQLYITDDAHIAVENGPGQCLDVRAESGPQPEHARAYGSQKDLQTWDCFAGSPNQILIFEDSPAGPPQPPSSPSSPSAQGQPIKWLRQTDGVELCLQVDSFTGPLESQLRNGAGVTFGDCFSETSDYLPFQRWVYNAGSTTICVAPNQYADTEFCIDFDTNLGVNGQRLKIWQRYEGLAAQQLYITDDAHIAVEGGPGVCADVRAESGPQPSYARPYGSQKDVQAWDCFAESPNQIYKFVL